MDYTDDVNGTIIGEVCFPYEFWRVNEFGNNEKIDHNFFACDDDAIEWFKEKHPAEYAKGVEMRVYQWRKT